MCRSWVTSNEQGRVHAPRSASCCMARGYAENQAGGAGEGNAHVGGELVADSVRGRERRQVGHARWCVVEPSREA